MAAAAAILKAREKLEVHQNSSLTNTVELKSCALELFENQSHLIRLDHVEGTESAFEAKLTAQISTEQGVHNFVEKYQEHTNEVLRIAKNENRR